jgi:hypothetical protein
MVRFASTATDDDDGAGPKADIPFGSVVVLFDHLVGAA